MCLHRSELALSLSTAFYAGLNEPLPKYIENVLKGRKGTWAEGEVSEA